MEALGAASTIIAIVTAVKDVIDLAVKIKESLEQVKANAEEHIRVANRVITCMEGLKRSAESGQPISVEFQAAVEALRLDLKDVLVQCEQVPFHQNSFRDWFRDWMGRNSTTEKLAKINKEIDECLQFSATMAGFRIEKTITTSSEETKDDLNVIKGMLRALIVKGESDPEAANRLIRAKQMTPYGIEKSLQYARRREAVWKNKPPLRDARRQDSERPTSLEARYLTLKVKTLTQALSQVEASSEVVSRPTPVSRTISSASHRTKTGDPAPEADDSILEVLRIIRTLQANKAYDMNKAAPRLDKLSLTLTDIGAYDVACEVSEVAVKASRKLGRHNFYLATALHNYSNHLSASGRMKDALAASTDAVDIFAELSRRGHLQHHADLAMALVTNSNCLIEEGSPEEAVQQARKACDIYQQLISHKRPDVRAQDFQSDIAVSLTTYAAALLEVGHVKDALVASSKSKDILAGLYRTSPHIFAPDYSASLATHASCLITSKQYKAALPWAEKAVEIRRDLARTRPDVYKARIASSLMDIFDIQKSITRPDHALKSVEEAASIYRELKGIRHHFSPKLAFCLRSWANYLIDLNREDERVLSLLGEALEIYHHLADSQPLDYTQHYAATFENLYHCYSRLGMHQQALDAATRLVELRKKMSLTGSSNDMENLAATFEKTFEAQCRLKNLSGALDAIQEACSIYGPLVDDHPDDWKLRSRLARSLYNMATLLTNGESRYIEPAKNAGLKALKHLNILYKQRPRSLDYSERLVHVYLNLSYNFSDEGSHKEALSNANSALQICRKTHNIPQYLHKKTLMRISYCYTNLGNHAKAMAIEKEAKILT